MKKLVPLFFSCIFLFCGCTEKAIDLSIMFESFVDDVATDVFGIAADDSEVPNIGFLSNKTTDKTLYICDYDDEDNPKSYWYDKNEIADDSVSRGKFIGRFDGNKVFSVKECLDMSRVILKDSEGNLYLYSRSSDFRHYTEEELELRAIADEALKKEYPIVNLEHFNITISGPGRDGHRLVIYQPTAYGYNIDGCYSVSITPENTVRRVEGEYSKYEKYVELLENIHPDAIRAAEMKLTERAQQYEELSPAFFFGFDEDTNDLFLSVEIIVDDSTHSAPCGDHSHIFLHEIVSKSK